MATSAEKAPCVFDDIPLLQPDQMRELHEHLIAEFPDHKDLCDELVHRGWLTAFQATILKGGQGRGLVLGPYILIDRLGQGGMGEVFKAHHRDLDRIVAAKVTRRDCLADPSDERRFLREIQATAQLTHPNIVTALDANQLEGIFVLAMEYVDGTNLAKLVREQGPLPVAKACDYIRQAALGLQHAFERGLVHRDIKPSNLLLTADGSTVKVSDLGLVRLGRGAAETPLTKSGALIGTPEYLAPEQATDSRHVDIRADLYSLGCTLYFLLTGRPPYTEGNAVAIVFQHAETPLPPVQSLRSGIPSEVVAVVNKLLAKKPADRYQQPSELVAALEPLCGLPEKTSPPTNTDGPPPKWWRSRRRLSAAGLLLVTAAGAGIILGQFQAKSSNESGLPPFSNSLSMTFHWIGAGASSGAHKPFYLANEPTKVDAFKQFVQAMRYQTEAEADGLGAEDWKEKNPSRDANAKRTWRSPGWALADDQPVVCLSRYDALAFCYWLGRKEGRAYRLPTESEWEAAMQSGSTTDEKTQGASVEGKAPGSFPTTLWQWCADANAPGDNAKTVVGPGTDKDRWGVLRGSPWGTGRVSPGMTARESAQVGKRRNDFGFRIVLDHGAR